MGKALGENIEESIVVSKIIRSLPLHFDTKVSSIEQCYKMGSVKVDEMHGILTSYEMRNEQENPSKK